MIAIHGHIPGKAIYVSLVRGLQLSSQIDGGDSILTLPTFFHKPGEAAIFANERLFALAIAASNRGATSGSKARYPPLGEA